MRRPALTSGILFCLTIGTSACHKPTPTGVSCGNAPGCDDFLPLPYIKVSPTNATIDVGMTVQMVDTITPDLNNPTNPTFTATWSSSDTTKATVNSAGLVTGKAVSSGVAICATIVNPGYDEDTCGTVIVQVSPPSGPTASSSRARLRPQDDAP